MQKQSPVSFPGDSDAPVVFEANEIPLLLTDVANELHDAYKKYPRFHSSLHESYAVLKEEVDELWQAIKNNDTGSSIHDEAVQVAAMALRMIIDNRLEP